ncbi:MAG: biopolymer transporter ExbD [Saprospiraceae bacterium]|nr:biopolymer transporter ExbD [Saprospiraceae bacterium]
MGLKRKNKVNALFNMSSLTDIIFLLLIFFMLTSSLVAPNALNLKLPGRSESAAPQTEQMHDVTIRANGTYAWNNRSVSAAELEGEMRKLARRTASQRTFTISPAKQSPVESVVLVMDLALRLNLNAVLLPEK